MELILNFAPFWEIYQLHQFMDLLMTDIKVLIKDWQ